jgi:hypothetical protein
MPEYDPQARERLLKLIRLKLGTDIHYDDFRVKYEDEFNFGLDKKAVSSHEFTVFQRLFDKIVWYSPVPEEGLEIPSYIGEAEMDAAVAEARLALGMTERGE